MCVSVRACLDVSVCSDSRSLRWVRCHTSRGIHWCVCLCTCLCTYVCFQFCPTLSALCQVQKKPTSVDSTGPCYCSSHLSKVNSGVQLHPVFAPQHHAWLVCPQTAFRLGVKRLSGMLRSKGSAILGWTSRVSQAKKSDRSSKTIKISDRVRTRRRPRRARRPRRSTRCPSTRTGRTR